MNQRFALSLIWLGGLITSVVLVELYIQLTVDGIPFLFPDQRGIFLRPVAALYGAVIAGILASWFIKRFKPPANHPDAQAVFVLALVCTLTWNLGVVYLIGQRLIWPEQGGTLEQDFATVRQFGTWFAFLVAPVNFYYFGIKPKPV